MPSNSEYAEIAKIKDELLREWYPCIQFGKHCLDYCGPQCDCDCSISLEVKMQAHKLAREQYEKKNS